MDITQKSPNVLSLCTGYGGIELGLERALGQLNVLTHVEIEAFAIANLVAKMETGVLAPAPIWTNLKTFRPAVFRNCVDILTGGYPCQPFSAAGKRKGKEDPRHLWPWIRDAIAAIKPGICFFENVEGHVSLGLREVLTDLVKLGYRVENDCGEPTWGLFSAAEVGAPHQRKRVFILAHSSDFRPRDFFGSVGCETGSEILRQGNRTECSVRVDSAGSDSELENSERTANRSEKGHQIIRKNSKRSSSGVSGSGNKLAHPRLLRQEKPKQQTAGVEQRGEELADPRSPELNRIPESEERWENREIGDSGIGLADSINGGQQNGRAKGYGETIGRNLQNDRSETQELCHLSPQGRWPARPGQPQYEWEEPRVLADSMQSSSRKIRRATDGREQTPEEKAGKVSGEISETQPKLGRAINGPGSRVDRLRLLGNGVVPATAEKAFRTLYERIINPDKNYIRPAVQIEMF